MSIEAITGLVVYSRGVTVLLSMLLLAIALHGGRAAAAEDTTVSNAGDLDPCSACSWGSENCEVHLLGCGYLDGQNALFVLCKEDVDFQYFTPNQTVIALDPDTAAPLKVLLDRDSARRLFQDQEWYVLGVDSQARVYLEVGDGVAVALKDGEILAREQSWTGRYGVDTMVFDGGLVSGNRYGLTHVSLGLDYSQFVPGDRIQMWDLPYKRGWDPPGASISVSPDGTLIYVSSEFEAWAWDSRGNLKFDLGTVYPSPGSIRGLPDGFDKEALYAVPDLYFPAPHGCFDYENRLWLWYEGQMWAVNERGQPLSDHFDLLDENGESFTPAEPYVFAPWDGHLFVMNWRTNVLYEYDLAPALELEQSDLDGLYYPAGKPPLLLRSFVPELN